MTIKSVFWCHFFTEHRQSTYLNLKVGFTIPILNVCRKTGEKLASLQNPSALPIEINDDKYISQAPSMKKTSYDEEASQAFIQ